MPEPGWHLLVEPAPGSGPIANRRVEEGDAYHLDRGVAFGVAVGDGRGLLARLAALVACRRACAARITSAVVAVGALPRATAAASRSAAARALVAGCNALGLDRPRQHRVGDGETWLLYFVGAVLCAAAW